VFRFRIELARRLIENEDARKILFDRIDELVNFDRERVIEAARSEGAAQDVDPGEDGVASD